MLNKYKSLSALQSIDRGVLFMLLSAVCSLRKTNFYNDYIYLHGKYHLCVYVVLEGGGGVLKIVVYLS